MNKYQKTLDFIKVVTNGGEGIARELNILQELVCKEQVKEVKNVEEFWTIETLYGVEFTCPGCGERLESYEGVYEYCPRCGQKLTDKQRRE